MYLEEKDSYGDYGDLSEIKSKYVFWCISNHGPFRSYLFKMNLKDNNICRYCKVAEETSLHLISCENLLNLIDIVNTEDQIYNLETNASLIIKKLLKDDF